ncbi:MAG: hypothetical protein ACYST6_05550 [Planctomycetota bacterium]
MSTLTKILVVLLTLSSIYLAAIVGTYASHANNYRELSNQLTRQRDTALDRKAKAENDLDNKKNEYETQEDQMKAQVASLKTEVTELNNQFEILKIQKTTLEEKMQGWVAMTDTLTKTNEDQGLLLTNTLEELKQVKAMRIKEKQQLDDVTRQLMEKVAVIDTLDKEKRLLEEERAALRQQLDQYQLRIGKEPAPPARVTPEPVPTTMTVPTSPLAPEPKARDIGLKGLITAIDFNNSLAEISIGAAHGAKNGMRFFVTRGEQFICEILIFAVDTEQAVGVLERVRYQPKVGDQVSTNL